MLAKLKERDSENRHCLKCGSSMEWRGGWMNSGSVIIFGKETKWVRCPACGFGVSFWEDGTVKTNQWAGDEDPEHRNIWAGDWEEVPRGCLLVVSEVSG